MVAAVCENVEIKSKPKRIRYKVPTYKKVDKINKNIKEYRANEYHIFRYRTLHKILDLLAFEMFHGQHKLYFRDWRLIKDGVVINFDDLGAQVEILGTELLPVGERLKIHIELLRQLRQGVKFKKAVRIVKRKAKKIL